jgi:hypothetical protein
MTTLTEVTEQLEENKEATEDTTDAVSRLSNSIDKFILNIERSQFDKLEGISESSGGLQSTTQSGAGTSADEKTGGGIFGGLLKALGITGLFQGITRSLAPILAPIAALYTLLKGPKLLKTLGIFGLMYEIFKDIGENEALQNTLQKITDLWNNSMLPSLRAIGDSVLNFVNSIDATTEFKSLSDWWSNIRTTLQDFVAFTLEDIALAIDGVLTGIKTTLDGDWKNGIAKIINSVLIGIQDIADNAITAVLKLFGVDFGEDGTFLGYLDRKWAELKTSIQTKWDAGVAAISAGWNATIDAVTNTWTNVTTAITDGWQSIVDFFTVSIPAKFKGIKLQIIAIAEGIGKSVVDAATSMIEVITVDIPNKIGEAKDAIIEKAAGLYDAVLTKVNSLIASIVDLIPSGADIKNGIINAIKALPGGEALLDMIGLSYEPAPKKMNTDADFFEQEIRTNKGMSINPMSYPGAQSFGTAYTSNPGQRFSELMSFRQPAGTIPAPVIVQDNSVKQGGSSTQVINQMSQPVSSMDLSAMMRNQGVRFGHGPYGY